MAPFSGIQMPDFNYCEFDFGFLIIPGILFRVIAPTFSVADFGLLHTVAYGVSDFQFAGANH
jgi:hypothetical protein